MGDTPCSEIFYGPICRNLELVFMQFEQHKDDTQTKLPKPCVDTGMGLERIVCIL